MNPIFLEMFDIIRNFCVLLEKSLKKIPIDYSEHNIKWFVQSVHFDEWNSPI